MNSKNGDLGAGADSEQVKEHLRAAKDAAASAARARARQARDWASSRMDDLQTSVEAQPYKASAWALGAGFLAGILVMSLIRNSRR
ncbi:MAG: hypothetical protein JSR66_05905 [Proteobacteria bacterium]|nr:hypothetical protein [Pseudomonadota bacterium]